MSLCRVREASSNIVSPVCISVSLEVQQAVNVTFQRGALVSCYSGLVLHGERGWDARLSPPVKSAPTVVKPLVYEVHLCHSDENPGWQCDLCQPPQLKVSLSCAFSPTLHDWVSSSCEYLCTGTTWQVPHSLMSLIFWHLRCFLSPCYVC